MASTERHSDIESPQPAQSAPPFALAATDLTRIVHFDNRTDTDYVRAVFHTEAGGAAGLATALRTDLANGLACSSDTLEPVDREARVAAYGVNKIEIPPRPSLLSLIWTFIKSDTIIQILLAGATIILIIGTATHPSNGWYEGVAIFVAVGIVLAVTAGNDWIKEGKFRKMMELKNDKTIKVMRAGQLQTMSTFDLVVGDVVVLSTGDEVPGDGFVISSSRLALDESPLTGEPIAVKKDSEHAPFLFGGTFVSEGSGHMCITAVGKYSMGGEIQDLLFRGARDKPEEESVKSEQVSISVKDDKKEEQKKDSWGEENLTPLQLRLRHVGFLVGKIGLAAGVVTFLALGIRWAVVTAQLMQAGNPWEWDMLLEVVEYFVISVTVVVVAVPEGLPLAVTISLGYAMFRMMKDHCFVRHLDASETMGEATCICTDKTGTLTENRMTVVKVLTGGLAVDLEKPEGQAPATFFTSEICGIISEGVAINSTAFLKPAAAKSGMGVGSAAPEFVGSATEGALLVYADKLGFPDYEGIRQSCVVPTDGVLPFSSARKRMSTLVEKIDGGVKGYRLHVKGASEIVLDLCTKRIASPRSAEAVALSESERIEIGKTINEWAGQGLRTIGIAFKDMDALPDLGEESPEANALESELVFLGLFGIKDPVRKEVPEAVAACQGAGLVVRMVTGDNILTANKIAEECGILDLAQGHTSIEGPEFRALSDAQRREILPSMRVLARSSPSDKFILVSLLRAMGETVAVTGDGTNDAAALNEADVGFAMGLSGTQIAMNASDIILTDDNFASIVNGIRWGRNVYDGIRKFLQFQLSVNFVAIILTLVGSLLWGRAPLNSVQLLWVNLIMDSLGAVALASDRPGEEILNRKPDSRSAHMINTAMRWYMLSIVIYQLVLLLAMLFLGETMVGYTEEEAQNCTFDLTGLPSDAIWLDSCRGTWRLTAVFTTFIMLQVFNLITTRQLDGGLNLFRGLQHNPIFLSMIVAIVAVQIIVVTFAGAFMDTVPLKWYEWLICTAWAAGSLVWVFATRIGARIYASWARDKSAGDVAEASPKFENAVSSPTVKVGVIENVDSEGAATLRDKQPATTGGLELPLLTVRRPNSEITLAASDNGTSSGYESDNRSQIR